MRDVARDGDDDVPVGRGNDAAERLHRKARAVPAAVAALDVRGRPVADHEALVAPAELQAGDREDLGRAHRQQLLAAVAELLAGGGVDVDVAHLPRVDERYQVRRGVERGAELLQLAGDLPALPVLAPQPEGPGRHPGEEDERGAERRVEEVGGELLLEEEDDLLRFPRAADFLQGSACLQDVQAPVDLLEERGLPLGHGDPAFQGRERRAGEGNARDAVLADDVARHPGVGGDGVELSLAQQLEAVFVVGDHDQLGAGLRLEPGPGQAAFGHADAFAAQVVRAVDRDLLVGDEQAEGMDDGGRREIPQGPALLGDAHPGEDVRAAFLDLLLRGVPGGEFDPQVPSEDCAERADDVDVVALRDPVFQVGDRRVVAVAGDADRRRRVDRGREGAGEDSRRGPYRDQSLALHVAFPPSQTNQGVQDPRKHTPCDRRGGVRFSRLSLSGAPGYDARTTPGREFKR